MKTCSCLLLSLVMIVPLSAQNRMNQEVFNHVSMHLDSGGRVYVFISVKDRLRELMGKANGMMESALENWANAFPLAKELDFEKILLSLGLHQIEALA